MASDRLTQLYKHFEVDELPRVVIIDRKAKVLTYEEVLVSRKINLYLMSELETN